MSILGRFGIGEQGVAKDQDAVKLKFRGKEYSPEPGESVLDTLLRSGLDMPHSCKAGLCQACVMKTEEGIVPDKSQNGLSAAQQSMGYFLACQCVPEQTISVASIDQTNLRVALKVKTIEPLSESVTRLCLEGSTAFRAGQYVTLWPTEAYGRSYSIASTPDEGVLEFHVKNIEGGRFSAWLRDEAKVGVTVEMQGPMGLCFYNAEADAKLVMTCIGTGLAPMIGILKDALAEGHSGDIRLVVGAKTEEGFYEESFLRELEQLHENLSVDFLVQEGDVGGLYQVADIYEYATNEIGELKGSQIYICGAESFVKKMKRTVFMAGANMQDIHSDSFLASAD